MSFVEFESASFYREMTPITICTMFVIQNFNSIKKIPQLIFYEKLKSVKKKQDKSVWEFQNRKTK
jgi:hypothetical protein